MDDDDDVEVPQPMLAAYQPASPVSPAGTGATGPPPVSFASVGRGEIEEGPTPFEQQRPSFNFPPDFSVVARPGVQPDGRGEEASLFENSPDTIARFRPANITEESIAADETMNRTMDAGVQTDGHQSAPFEVRTRTPLSGCRSRPRHAARTS
eukprot:TRINITY_DN21989_c0_g1_i1.p2 TRINITY_DN21989_c0_g1~~TRINITY_DN21989_c0_g1_i1.p2  ORF type:complete len:153 (-),score=5.86 TRINITY_DN21989_c0_g1_i1:46-504(-)